MNTGGILGILCIFLLVFVLVAYNADIMQGQLNQEITNIAQQRDQAVDLTKQAEENMKAANQRASNLEQENARVARELDETRQHAAQLAQQQERDQQAISSLMQQRDEAANTAQALTQQLTEKNQLVANKDQELAGLDEQLAELNARFAAREQELEQALAKNAALQQDVTSFKAQIAALETEPAVVIPVSGGGEGGQELNHTGSGEAPAVTAPAANLLQLPGVGAVSFPFLVVLVGMVALGGSGYAVYHFDPQRKVTIRMTRAEVKAFIRYQRERTGK